MECEVTGGEGRKEERSTERERRRGKERKDASVCRHTKPRETAFASLGENGA